MQKSVNIYLLIFVISIDNCLGQLKKLPIKSHKVLSENIAEDKMSNMYDNNMGTAGSIYHMSTQRVKIDLDLGSDYIVEKIVTTIGNYESPEVSFLVGNLIKKEYGLEFNCTSKNNVFECIPKCVDDDALSGGIVSRKLLMSFLLNGKWASIYEVEVYGKTTNENSEYISDNRLVQPDDCQLKSWLLTRSVPNMKAVAYNNGTKIILEKRYIIDEVTIQFINNNLEILKLQLTNENGKHKDLDVNIEKCTSVKTTFICPIDEPTFPTRIVTLKSAGVSHLMLKGKTVVYPMISLKASTNPKERLKLTCQTENCNPMVQADCSKVTTKSKVQFPCNMRLIRMPGNDQETHYIIANEGQINKIWADTKFAVESYDAKKTVVSMPRSYQYFGQYRCSCIVADESATEILSKVSNLKESDFIEKIVFDIRVKYKIDDDESTMFKESVENLIIIPVNILINAYIVVKTYAMSLIEGIEFSGKYPSSGRLEPFFGEETKMQSIKAFDNNQSWSVRVFNYTASEIYPDFEHHKQIIMNFTSKKYNITQISANQFIKINKADNEKPEILKDVTDKYISLKLVYSSIRELKMVANEQTCSKNTSTVMAILHNHRCKPLTPQATCTNIDDLVLLSIKKERNIETKYKYSLIESTSNKTINQEDITQSMVLNEKDINTKIRFVDINADPANAQETLADVEIEFISKVVADFIPCGKVVLKIMEPQSLVKQLVLQSTKHRIPVSLNQDQIKLTIMLEIEGLQGSYNKNFQINNPLNQAVKNVKIEGNSKMNLFWSGIDKITDDILVGYEVKTTTTIIACNDSQIVNNRTILKKENIAGKNNYRTELGTFNRNHSLLLHVQVQPVFLNNKRGLTSEETRHMPHIRPTKIIIDNSVLTKQRSVKIEPSQLNIPCPIKSVKFLLESTNLEHVTQLIEEKSKLEYTFTDLVPGRQYRISATVHYQFGPTDNTSTIYVFETADDISLDKSIHIAEINDVVNITCTADVGPEDKFRKTIEWRRADDSPLPFGVNSVVSADHPNMGFLIMKKAIADSSGDYGCFVKPAAKIGGANITVIINDLEVKPKERLVNFTPDLDPISTKCSSLTVGEGKLIWIDADNNEISNGEDFKVETTITTEKTIESILTIPKPSLKMSGVYQCVKPYGKFKATRTFSLYGEEKLNITSLTNNAEYIGETTRLRCTAQRASKTQKVTWTNKDIVANNRPLIKTNYPDPSNLGIQDIEIINNLDLPKVSCRLTPAINEKKIPLKKTFSIKLSTKIHVEGPRSVLSGQTITLKCIGYQNKPLSVLQWVFYKKESINTTSTEGNIVLSSENQPRPFIYEPVKLDLSFPQINDTQSGRYECKFKDDSTSLAKKSLLLDVEANKEVNFGRVKCDNCRNKSNRIQWSKAFSVCLVGLSILLIRAMSMSISL